MNNSSAVTLADIERHINDLRREAKDIAEAYKKLVEFYQANALLPVHDQLTDYLELLIVEEEHKLADGANNMDVIENLKRTKHEMENAIKSVSVAGSTSSSASDERRDTLSLEDVFSHVEKLYNLSIHGKFIREQVEKIREVENETTRERERRVQLLTDGNQSKMLQTLIDITSE